jgi:toxin ParE1/3/4
MRSIQGGNLLEIIELTPHLLLICSAYYCRLPSHQMKEDNMLTAEEQLASLYRNLAVEASPKIAEKYTNAIVTYCIGLSTSPQRGNRRDEIRPGLRITNYRRRTAIAFEEDENFISIIGIFHVGQDYETILQSDDNDMSIQ